MLTKAQKESIIKSTAEFAESLNQDQCIALYFILSAIQQYGSILVPAIFRKIYEITKQKEPLIRK